MTLNQLIHLLKRYSRNHQQLNDFGHGDISEWGTKKDIMYPIMWVTHSSGRFSQKQMYYNLQLIFSDLIFNDKSNELDVQSDMLLCGLDTIAYLRDNPDFDFQIDGDITIDFFTERFADLTSGCVFGVTLRDPRPLDRCQIPLNA